MLAKALEILASFRPARSTTVDWRVGFANVFGPGMFGGTLFRDWWRLLRDHRFQVDPVKLPRVISTFASTLQTSFLHRVEESRFRRKWEQTSIHPPLIILGHWRSGTTHLHNLLSQDDRYAFPNLYQVLNPHTFLSAERINSRLAAVFLPKTRFGLDNVRLSWSVPYEDEFAIGIASFRSPFLSYAWPHSHAMYDRYLTLRDVDEPEIQEWRDALLTFARKLTWKYQKPLILKSPSHTGKIRLLLELFPDAKFVHIHRDPYAVFQSSQRLVEVALAGWRLQDTGSVDWDAWILQQYTRMYDAFFDECSLIPAGRFHELTYTQLESDPMREMRRLYEVLDLPDFAKVEPALQSYVDSISGYQKNSYSAIPDSLSGRVASEWQRCFDRWGYQPQNS